MDLAGMLVAQLADPFRIALAIGLVITMGRTQGVTGTWLPLLAGVVFIAVIIPMTMQTGRGDLVAAIGVGLVSTAAIVGVVMAVRALVLRAMGR